MRIDFGVGDAVVVDQAVQHRVQLIQPHPAAFGERVGQFGPGRPHVAVMVEELVVTDARARRTGGAQIEQCLLGACGAVPGQQAVGVVAITGGTGNRR